MISYVFAYEGKNNDGALVNGWGPEIPADCEENARRKFIEILNEKFIYPRKITLLGVVRPELTELD